MVIALTMATIALLPFALADIRIHVERAERVLGATDVTMSGMSPMTARVSLPQSAVSAASVPITPLNVTPLAVIEPTVNSWGGSDPVVAPRRPH